MYFKVGCTLLSSSSSKASAIASTPREHARYGLREDRIDEADHPGPEMEDGCDDCSDETNQLR